MKKRSLLVPMLCVAMLPWSSVRGQDHAAELPKQLAAVRAGADLHAAKTISVTVAPRRTQDSLLPVRADKLRASLKKGMGKTPYTVVDDASTAQFNAELVVEPTMRWGEFHSQNSPYLFLLVREHSTARVLFCGYRRVGFFYDSALNDLVKDLAENSKAATPTATGDLNACAKEAMRLPEVGL